MIVVAVVLLAALGLVVAYRRRELLAASWLVLVFGAVAFLLAFLAIGTDYRDADGFFDCWPNCTALQDTVGIAFFTGPAIAFLGVAGLGLESVLRRRR
jgi:hypothetical protein